jgi:hypothetical protein
VDWIEGLAGFCRSGPQSDETRYVLYLFTMLERENLRKHALEQLGLGERPGLFPCFYLAKLGAGPEGAEQVVALLEGKWHSLKRGGGTICREGKWLQAILFRSDARVAGRYALAEFAAAEDVTMRRHWASLLGSVPHPDVIHHLTPLLGDEPDSKTRIAMLNAVGAMEGEGGLQTLGIHLLSDSSPEVRRRAAWILTNKFPVRYQRFGGRRTLMSPRFTRNRYLSANEYTGMRERLSSLHSGLVHRADRPPRITLDGPWKPLIFDPLALALESDSDVGVRREAAKGIAEIVEHGGEMWNIEEEWLASQPESFLDSLEETARMASNDTDAKVRAAADTILLKVISIEGERLEEEFAAADGEGKGTGD